MDRQHIRKMLAREAGEAADELARAKIEFGYSKDMNALYGASRFTKQEILDSCVKRYEYASGQLRKFDMDEKTIDT